MNRVNCVDCFWKGIIISMNIMIFIALIIFVIARTTNKDYPFDGVDGAIVGMFILVECGFLYMGYSAIFSKYQLTPSVTDPQMV